MATQTTDTAPPDSPRSESDTGRLTFAVEMLTKSIDRLDREIGTMRSDARTDFATLRSDVRTDFATLRSDARTDFATLRSDARTDFRLVFGALIAVALGLAGMMAKGFRWI